MPTVCDGLSWAFLSERVTRIELAPSAWEACSTAGPLPADSMTCRFLGELRARDRDSPRLRLMSGTWRARKHRSLAGQLARAVS
jgi:hypothetical protein